MRKKVTSIILCGGKGERLRPLTKEIPKPLININEKPILLKYLVKAFDAKISLSTMTPSKSNIIFLII